MAQYKYEHTNRNKEITYNDLAHAIEKLMDSKPTNKTPLKIKFCGVMIDV